MSPLTAFCPHFSYLSLEINSLATCCIVSPDYITFPFSVSVLKHMWFILVFIKRHHLKVCILPLLFYISNEHEVYRCNWCRTYRNAVLCLMPMTVSFNISLKCYPDSTILNYVKLIILYLHFMHMFKYFYRLNSDW